MAIYDNLPFTDFHELNADWLLKQMKAAKAKVDSMQEEINQFNEDYAALAALFTISGNNVSIPGTMTANGFIGNLTGNAAQTTLDTALASSTDANDFVPATDGFHVYQVDALNSNAPSSQTGEAAVLLTVRYRTDHVLQVAWFYINSQNLFYRQKYYNSWQGWYKLTATSA